VAGKWIAAGHYNFFEPAALARCKFVNFQFGWLFDSDRYGSVLYLTNLTRWCLCTCTCCAHFTKLPFLLPLAAAAANGRPVPPHQQQHQQQQHVAHSCNTSAAGLSELPPTAAGDLVRRSVCHQAFPFSESRERINRRLYALKNHFRSILEEILSCIMYAIYAELNNQ